jgi:fatty-acyl-CoA synthase
VLAKVVPTPGATVTPEEIIAHCRNNLAHFKCPTKVELVESIPRTSTGKVQKFLLREPYWKDHDRHVG